MARQVFRRYTYLPWRTSRTRERKRQRDKYPIKGRLETLLETAISYIYLRANGKRRDENGQETRPFNITRNRYDSIRRVIGDIGDAYRRDTHPTNSRKASSIISRPPPRSVINIKLSDRPIGNTFTFIKGSRASRGGKVTRQG